MDKSKETAAFLALFGGIFGLHKFYLNDTGGGIFYSFLSFMTWRFFLPFGLILGVIDALRLFSMSTEKFDRKYNSSGGRRRAVRRSRPERQSRVKRDGKHERNRYKYQETRAKKRSNPFLKSANQKFKEYDLEGALEDYKKAEEITEADKNVHFNKACIYSLLEQTDKSLFHLQEAIKLGFKDKTKIETIDELAFLRIQPSFEIFKNNGYVIGQNNSISPPKDDLLQGDVLLSQLNKLKELRSRGLLSEKEFSYEKEKLLRR